MFLTLCCSTSQWEQFHSFWLWSCHVTVLQCIMDAVKTPAKGKYVCVFSVSDQWEKSEHCFFCDRDWLRAGTLPSVPCLIYMHRWHGISIVTAPPKKLRELTGDIWQLILRAQLQSFACILLYSGAFSSHSPALCSAQWAYLQTVSLFRAGDWCVCLCVSVDVCVWESEETD